MELMMKTLKLLALATVLAIAPACTKKKTEDKAPPETPTASGSAPAGSGSAPAGSGSDMAAGSGSATEPAGSGSATAPTTASDDSIVVEAEHAKKKPDDPVAVKFTKFTVVKASFDPAKIEGGTATIEVDLTSLTSGSDKRDAHLASPDYIDTGKFAKLTIDVANVKKGKADKQYTADATVKLRDVEKKYSVKFEVVDAKDDWIKIKGEHEFGRLDFKVGKDPAKDKNEGVAPKLKVKVALTLKKTA
jgi:polyisoprenoid-binding protein YceI